MNVNVTKIERLSNGIIQFYNGSEVVDSFSITSSVSVLFDSNVAKSISFISNVKTLSFNVYNVLSVYGATSNKIYSAGIDPSDTSSAYISRLYDIYAFLISDVIQGCCPGPTFVGGVVASYPNFASFPATGQQSVIYIDEADNSAYYWDGSSYQLLIAKNVEQYASFALFPVTGTANVIYIDMSVPEPYVWNGTTYESLTDSATVAWGSITGTLAAQTDLQAALDAKFDDPTGTTAEYVRGDGSLATFPSSTGGGASLSFYLNGSVSQGTFGGVAMREMDRVPIIGAGTDFTIATNGYIQSFITDANVPNLLEIPAGNWNFETYFSASSNGGTPSYYIELYKWDGATLSLIASGSANPEGITNGTATHLYVSAIAVPQTTLALTDRLAVRIYVNNSGRTIKLHTENSHLCQVITTFSTGLTALNGLTAQVQNFATGTSGTDFGISSATSTHTFNLPTASATNRGALSSADWTTFNSKVPSTRSLTINGTTQDLSADRTFTIATGLTVGTTPITSGTVGRVLFEGTGNVLQEDAGLSWDNTNKRLSLVSSGDSLLNLTPQASGNAIVFNNNSFIKWGTVAYMRGFSTSALFSVLNSSFTNVFNIGTSSACYVNTGSNFLIGTTTDAGYKLDVNGTARIKGVGTTTAITFSVQNSASTNLLTITDAGSFATTTSNFSSVVTNNSNSFQVTGSIAAIRVGSSITIASSSILQADSTTQGFLPPRQTQAQRLAIASPAVGLIVYQTDLIEGLYVYKSVGWTFVI
jgi:hypothetical protein